MGTKKGTRVKRRPDDSPRVLFGWKAGTPHPALHEMPREMSATLARVLDRDEAEVREDARRYFLGRVRDLRPGVLADLATVLADLNEPRVDETLPRLSAECEIAHAQVLAASRRMWGPSGADLLPWATRWGLATSASPPDHWVLDYAVDTASLWRDAPTARGHEWSLNRASGAAKWVPTRGRLPAFKHREIPRHRFDWLIDLQVHDSEHDKTFAEVARAYGVDQRAVSDGCKELAAALDLPILTRGE